MFLKVPLSVLSLIVIILGLYFNVLKCGKLDVIDCYVLPSRFTVDFVYCLFES